jgi:hypothetical protein
MVVVVTGDGGTYGGGGDGGGDGGGGDWHVHCICYDCYIMSACVCVDAL